MCRGIFSAKVQLIPKALQVLMPRWRCQLKLHNIKLLIASFYTYIDYDDNFTACKIQNHWELKEWVMIDHDCC